MQAALRWKRRSLRLIDGLLQTLSIRRIGLVDLLLELLHLLLGLFGLFSLERSRSGCLTGAAAAQGD
ncbi:hypothetical protein [Ectopseudomonas toyotomiensis]|uniref:Uncharacterized protein n=1 Tax=Ectopseudomonas toyotomiensis TaxID=554344 RepID=A0AA42LK85_9GAMM|nr:hypothetical protein [Pseudomonas toyotomiensis]MBG0841461.1 hypothetical protein [Pseudomonas toyotomiensis]MDH0700515.1 hypothetical protein [Pseudomonas toyotomiensis]